MDNTSYIIACESCGTKNRVPKEKINNNPICAKCKTPLPADRAYDRPVDITDSTFQKEVLDYQGAVLVDCWAPWCGPCRSVGPILDQLAREFAGRIKIAKLNIDENQMTASRYAVQSVPTMLFFKKGQMVDTAIGALPKMEIATRIKNII